MTKTLGEIKETYQQRRNDIREAIREGRVSASMSGIEYYYQDWDDLDMDNQGDRYIVMQLIGA